MKLPEPLREILVIVWPLGAAAIITELGYLMPFHVPGWMGITAVVVIPAILGATLLYRFIDKSNRFRVILTIVYGVLALFACPYVALIVAAANGDAL